MVSICLPMIIGLVFVVQYTAVSGCPSFGVWSRIVSRAFSCGFTGRNAGGVGGGLGVDVVRYCVR